VCGGFAGLPRAIPGQQPARRETVNQALTTRENQGNLAPVNSGGLFLSGRLPLQIRFGSDRRNRGAHGIRGWSESSEGVQKLDPVNRKESGEPPQRRDMLVAVFKEPGERDSDVSPNPKMGFPRGCEPHCLCKFCSARAVRRSSDALFPGNIDREMRGSRALKCKRRDRPGARLRNPG
jgi:hypothetical protein